jgi:hypothetical protein
MPASFARYKYQSFELLLVVCKIKFQFSSSLVKFSDQLQLTPSAAFRPKAFSQFQSSVSQLQSKQANYFSVISKKIN